MAKPPPIAGQTFDSAEAVENLPDWRDLEISGAPVIWILDFELT